MDSVILFSYLLLYTTANKNRKGQVHHEELTNSRRSKDYLHVSEIKEQGDNIVVDVKGSKFRKSKKELGMV